MINYTPFGHSDWQSIVSDIKKFGSAGKKPLWFPRSMGMPTCLFTGVGQPGISAENIPVVAFSVGEEELSGIDTKPWLAISQPGTGFQSVEAEENDQFIAAWRKYIKNEKRVTNDPMEAHYIGFNMWVKAVEKAGTTDPLRFRMR